MAGQDGNPTTRWLRPSRKRPTDKARPATPPHPKTLENLKANLGAISTVATRRLETDLGWFEELRADERSELGLVAQRGISSFVRWYEDPEEPLWVLTQVFRSAPTELTRSISLQHALQLLRIVVDVVEEKVPELAKHHDEAALREAVLRYSREIAFAAADVYARAAENRGSWDARLESLVVDGILRGEHSDSLRSRVAALGWASTGPVTVLTGSAPEATGPATVARLRRLAARHAQDSLVSIQGDRLVLILGGLVERETALEKLTAAFGPGPVAYGPESPTIFEAGRSARLAHAALSVAPAWPAAPRPVHSEDLWPERAMAGDEAARAAMIESVYRPLTRSATGLAETLSAYVSVGHSLEATARELFVHANTVRYRLRRICDLTGWDPLVPRDAFVLHCALLAGRLADSCAPLDTSAPAAAPVL
ncbi:PucR family transcriptional regulator [Kocuria sediminis]|uniref:PucR family transcriptional regulator n=1 Tax=Kocuria sediminis TaxID=1038857 RepID=A0A6N8GGQ2_9MICC|nr:helix-turn-helix domain-containing protein [Kocuria sediminis]MUN61889.1 PucR family transcriptional regulator [Kocuria sediminis]